jgi:hypothetical protein
MRVRIKSGLLAGAEGILLAKKQRHRLVISVDLIQQSVAVDVDSAEVEPLEPRPLETPKLTLGSSQRPPLQPTSHL